MTTFLANLLRADTFNFQPEFLKTFTLVPRRCYNYELEFFTSSSGWIIMEHCDIKCKKGELNFRKPGEVATGVPPYSGYIICFSLEGKEPYDDFYFGSKETKESGKNYSIIQNMPSNITPSNPKEIEVLLQDIIRLFSSSNDFDRYKSNILLNQLLLSLMESTSNNIPKIYNQKVLKIQRYLQENFLENICVDDIIEKTNLSKAYFHRCFKEITNTSPNNYIINLRIETAKKLLTITDDKIYDIAMHCGYLDSVYFSKIFKKYVGKTPREYRRLTQNK
ncbi:MAG: AraC family transcriptional regulator [Clostridia bacterium]